MSAVFTSAKSKKWNYFKGANPISEIDDEHKLGKSAERTRRFVGDEEKKLLAELDKHCRNRDIPLVVRFAVATAARQSEIIGKAATSKAQATPGLTWERIDLKMRSATFTDTKNGKDRVIPLGDAAYAILSSLPRPIKGGKIFNVTQDGLIRAMQTCTKSAEIEDFTFHDLRHEATSRMIEDGMPTVIVQKITGHSNAEMLKRYTHLDILKQAMTMR
jgi:integrase